MKKNPDTYEIPSTSWRPRLHRFSLVVLVLALFSPLTLVLPAPQAHADDFVHQSLRFISGNTDYLVKTMVAGTDRKKWTFSVWIKRSTPSTTQGLFSAGTNGVNDTGLYFSTDNKLNFYDRASSAITGYIVTTSTFADPAAWIHVVAVFDSANGTDADKMRLYVNGVRQAVTVNNQLPLNTQSQLDSAIVHYIGTLNLVAGYYLDGYMADAYFVDGQALDPSSFAQTDGNGFWRVKAYTGTYGTNGFHLTFSNPNITGTSNATSTVGADVSGNANNWPNTFFNGDDVTIDTPTNGFETLNPLKENANLTMTKGNLYIAAAASNVWQSTMGVFGVSSGKWYWEVIPKHIDSVNSANNYMIGIGNTSYNPVPDNNYPGSGATSYGYQGTANKYPSGAVYGATYTTNDVVGVGFDVDGGTLTFYKNGVSQGTAFSSIAAGTWLPAIGAYNSTQITANFGQLASSTIVNRVVTYYPQSGGYFYFPPPTGYKAISTANITVATSSAGWASVGSPGLLTLSPAGPTSIIGNLFVAGSVTKSAGNFVIDDPINVLNKLLYHSFVESPDAKNIYDGIATLDGSGSATITLPDYFLPLNTDFRYLSTAIGSSMPNLYLSDEVHKRYWGLFGAPVITISGGSAGGKISWQVTGNRHDPYILANPSQTEVDKGADQVVDRGQYVCPDCFPKR